MDEKHGAEQYLAGAARVSCYRYRSDAYSRVRMRYSFLLAESGLPFVIIRPGGLSNDPPSASPRYLVVA